MVRRRGQNGGRPSVIVIDASALLALLIGSEPEVGFIRAQLSSAESYAPELLLFEVTNVLRRLTGHGRISADQATLAHADLLRMPVILVGYRLAGRIWALRSHLSSYDASYVALAEALPATLITLDLRMARAPGVACAFATPP